MTKAASVDVVGRDFVRDIDDARARRDAQNHAFHRAHKVVGKSEIRGESDQPVGSACTVKIVMNAVQRYYFDHNATTPVSPEVLEAMLPVMTEVFGNASSIHHFGQAARQKLDEARRHVAAMLGAKAEEIVFTSGGTEADNLAMFGSRSGGHVDHHDGRTSGGACEPARSWLR